MAIAPEATTRAGVIGLFMLTTAIWSSTWLVITFVVGVMLMFLPERSSTRPACALAVRLAYAGGSTLVSTGGTLVSMRLQRARLPIVSTTAWGMAYGAAVPAIISTLAGKATAGSRWRHSASCWPRWAT